MIETSVERYLVDSLVPEQAGITVLLQDLHRVDVHWHDFYELVYVRAGSALHRLNGEARVVGPGSIIMLTPADFHEFEATTARSLWCYNVVANPWLVERELDDLLPCGVSWEAAVLDRGASLEPDFARLWREFDHGAHGSAALKTAILRCILVEASRLRDDAAPDDDAQSTRGLDDVRRAIRYVEQHFREPLTLAEVAAEARLSPNYLSERFRQVTGTPFQAFLQSRRLRFARSLLASTQLGVTEICHAAGFNSPSHFGRAYRRRYGETPSATRAGAE